MNVPLRSGFCLQQKEYASTLCIGHSGFTACWVFYPMWLLKRKQNPKKTPQFLCTHTAGNFKTTDEQKGNKNSSVLQSREATVTFWCLKYINFFCLKQWRWLSLTDFPCRLDVRTRWDHVEVPCALTKHYSHTSCDHGYYCYCVFTDCFLGVLRSH